MAGKDRSTFLPVNVQHCCSAARGPACRPGRSGLGLRRQHNHFINAALKWRTFWGLSSGSLEDPSEVLRLDTFQSHTVLSGVN